MSGPSVVLFDRVRFSYGQTPALTDVSLAIDEGAFVGLVGPNGGGKSTLIKLALGLLAPDAGTVALFGGPPAKGRDRVGYVPQRFEFRRDFPITVAETVMTGRLGSASRFGRFSAADRSGATAALEQVGVGELSGRPLASLSGGQLQRVLIARALVSDPRLLILDEPTANVDMMAEQTLFDLLRSFNERMTILVVSHDIGFISRYVTTVVCLNRSLVCHETTPVAGALIEKMYGEPMAAIDHSGHAHGGHHHHG
jgi:zinc transport system ATP-binding protein